MTLRRYDLGDRTWYPHHPPPLFQTFKRARDAKCGTVVPQQVDLFNRWEVWRHTEVGCTRNRTLGGQRRG